MPGSGNPRLLGDIDLGLDENWAAIAPALLWPVWVVALGAGTAGYYYRRRGMCQHCGRGGDAVGPIDSYQTAVFAAPSEAVNHLIGPGEVSG